MADALGLIARRPLALGVSAPILGFGVSGPHGLGLADTTGLVRQALDGGAALFDTAPFYGDAEIRLGAALRGVARDAFILSSKVGTLRHRGAVRKDFGPAFIAASVEQSLRRLNCDALDVLLLHGPPQEALTQDLLRALEDLRTAGKIRLAGACVRGPLLACAIGWPGFQLIQGPVWETVEGRAWPHLAKAAGQAFWGVEALRAASPAWKAPRSLADLWGVARAVAQRTPPAKPTQSPAQALRAALKTPGVSSVITTTTRSAHLTQNLVIAQGVRA
jgi:aryl-alcohol dehydrogenase-like predicted oxidoreductase